MSSTLRRLGGSSLRVSPIGLGTWQFAGKRSIASFGMWAAPEQAEANAIVRAAIDGGINWFDTAELYGFGKSERRLANALLSAGCSPQDVVIATKWRPILRTAGSIKRTIDKRLESLAPFGIGLYQVHFPFFTLSTVREQMEAMAELVEEGKVQAVGVSNFDASQMREAFERLAKHGIPLASNQVKYSLLDRRIERDGTLEAARELGVTIIAYSPLEMGLLTGKFHRNPEVLARTPFLRRIRLRRRLEESLPVIETLEEIAKSHGATPAQVALSWTVNFHGDLVVAIPGATKTRQATENARAMQVLLTKEELELLDERTRDFR